MGDSEERTKILRSFSEYDQDDKAPSSLSSSTEIQNDRGDYVPLSQSTVTIETETPHNLKVGNMASLMHLVKGNVGTGILAMPNAVNNAGLWLGTAGILLIGGIAVHCMHMLLNCSHILRRRTKLSTLDYARTLEFSIKTGPKKLQRFARGGSILVNVFLIITQLGFCCIYLLFVAQNIKHFVDSFHPDSLSTFVYIIIVTIALIPYTFIKDLKHLSPFSVLANIMNFLGLAIIYQYLFRGLPNVDVRPAITSSFTNLPLYFGTVIFSYEGIGLVMPIENKMKTPEDFPGLSGVMNLGMAIVSSLYTSMGFYGYLKFGGDALGSITLNLPQKEWLYLSVNLMFAVSLFISYGLMFYVPMKITWPYISQKISSRKLRLYAEYPYRIAVVMFTFGVAAIVPHLDLLISLLGAFASCSLALMLPPIIEILTLSTEQGQLTWWKLIKDILIVLFGFLGFVTGTYSALKEIIKTF